MRNFGVVHADLDVDTLKFTITSMRVIRTEAEKDKAVRKVVRKNSEDLERARLLHAGAIESIENVTMAFIEVPVGSQDARAMASYGMCLGVIAAVANTIPIIQVTPGEVKLAGFGSKDATKAEMIEAMMKKHPEAPWPMRKLKGEMVPNAAECEHLADACAAIEAGLQTDEFRQAISVFKRMVKTGAIA
jgi:Holliday junction resolvasome RuvABC endonuclease subunit